MATTEARDLATDVRDEEQLQRAEVGDQDVHDSALIQAHDSVSLGPNGRQEAAPLAGNPGKRRRKRGKRKRNKRREETEETKDEEEETKYAEAEEGTAEEEGEEEEGASSVDASMEQDQEQKSSSDEEDQDEPFPAPEPNSPERSPSVLDENKALEQKLVEDEDNPSDKKGGGAKKATIDPEADEVLLRAVVAHEKQFTDESIPNQPVWASIAEACGDRFPKGASATGKVVWLAAVYRDQRHDQHAKFTDAMKVLIKQYLAFMNMDDSPRAMPKRRKSLPFKNPSSTRRTRLREQQRQQELSQQSQAGDNQPEVEAATGTDPEDAVAETEDEEEEKDDKEEEEEDDDDEDEEEEEEVEEVADGENALAGDNGEDSTPQASKAVSKRKLDVGVEEKLVKAAMKFIPILAATKLKAVVWDNMAKESGGLYKNGHGMRNHFIWLVRLMHDPNQREHAKITPKLRELLVQFEKACFSKKNPRRLSPKKSKAVDPPRKKSTKPAQPSKPTATSKKRPRGATYVEVDPQLDAKLMEIQLKFRPFDTHPYNERPAVWKQMISAINDPRFPNSTVASRRVFWLRMILAKTDHEQHEKLTPQLRKLIVQYNEAIGNSPYTGNFSRPSSAEPPSATRQPSSRLQEVADQSEPPRVKKKQRIQEMLAETPVITVAAEEVALPTTFEDHILMVEILRAPPFLANKSGGCNPQWERVANAVRKQIGSTAVLTTADACMRRMVKLLSAVRNPGGKLSVLVPSEQLELLTLIHTLTEFKTTWASMERKQTELYLSLKERMEALLSKPLPTTNVTPESEEEAAEEDEEVEEEEEEDEEDEEEEPAPVQETPTPVAGDREERRRKRKQSENGPSTSTISIGALFNRVRPSIAELLAPHEPVPLAENKPIAAQLKALHENVALCRAEITVHGSRLEKGRREHHQELLGMFELLKQEHDGQTNETAAMLERMERERLERRDEFANMIDLVSQALPSR